MPDNKTTLYIQWIQETQIRLKALERIILDRFGISEEEFEVLLEVERGKLPLPPGTDNVAVLNDFLTRALKRP